MSFEGTRCGKFYFRVHNLTIMLRNYESNHIYAFFKNFASCLDKLQISEHQLHVETGDIVPLSFSEKRDIRC